MVWLEAVSGSETNDFLFIYKFQRRQHTYSWLVIPTASKDWCAGY